MICGLFTAFEINTTKKKSRLMCLVMSSRTQLHVSQTKTLTSWQCWTISLSYCTNWSCKPYWAKNCLP